MELAGFFVMVGGKIYGPLSRILFKLVRLPYLIEYYIARGTSDREGIRKNKHATLISGSEGYQILDADKPRPIWITWPERFPGPANLISGLDGYWAVDVARPKQKRGLYHLYWIYPFDCNLHVWIINENGERTGAYEPNVLYKYGFFLRRIKESESFLVRLYIISDLWGDYKTCDIIKSDLFAAAKNGSSEAICCMLWAPKLFSNEELRFCLEKAIGNIDDICNGAVAAQDHKQKMVTLENLAQAVEAHESKFDFVSSADIQEKINYFEAFGSVGCATLRRRANKTSVHVHENIPDDTCMGSNFNAQSITIVGEPEVSELKFHILNSTDATRVRVMSSAAYVNYLMSVCEQKKIGDFRSQIFDKRWILDFEAGDLPGRKQCVAFERGVGDVGVGLIPDLYYFSSRGFRHGWIDGPVPPWTSKRTLFTWRGITSGAHNHTVDSIATLPRFRLCAMARQLGDLADIGISNVVQARSQEDGVEIEFYLKSMGLWRDYIPQHVMGSSKFLLEIDGYANSWGFFAKLLMGCCVLKVDSPYEQWFYQDLTPWIHYIPIARDLSNLLETMEWCLLNEPACRDIASAGMAFAEERTFEREMKAAAATMVSMVRPLV